MSIQRREVYLVLKTLPDGRVIYVEGIRCAHNYFFDGHSRVGLSAGNSASFVEFSPNERPMQLFHMPKENNGKWGSSQKTESMVTPVFATPILTISWLA